MDLVYRKAGEVSAKWADHIFDVKIIKFNNLSVKREKYLNKIFFKKKI